MGERAGQIRFLQIAVEKGGNTIPSLSFALMSTEIERLISEIKTLSPEQKLELARRLDEEDIDFSVLH